MRSVTRVTRTALVVSLPVLLAGGLWSQRGDTSPREPFRVFDNLSYVGDDVVSVWVLETSEGLILIDANFANQADRVLENIRTLGLDPADIRYVFVSHSHGDHAAGAPRIREVTGARVGMAPADWELFDAIPTDLVLEDGDEITLGDTTFRFYNTPGHTPGVLSMRFPVRDGANTYTAFMFGGVGLNFSGVDRTEMYLDSVRRLRQMTGIEVNIGNHPTMGDVFGRAERLASRQPGDPHPFVDPDAFTEWLAELETNGEAKLAEERAAGN